MQKLVVIAEYCLREAGGNCKRCACVCPHGAIVLPPGKHAPVVDHDSCNGCGICFGICDTFASTHITMADLHARIRRIAADGRRVYLTCQENVSPEQEPDSNVIVLPCISMISPTLWTLLLAEDIRLSIAGDLSLCETCMRAGALGGLLFPRAIEIAQERSGCEVHFSERIPEKQTLVEKYTANKEATDRRSLFTAAANDVKDITNGSYRLRNNDVLTDFHARRERMRATLRLSMSQRDAFQDFTPEGRRKHIMIPKHKLLLEAVERRHDIAPKIDIALSQTEAALCKGCATCCEACPTGARELFEGTAKVNPLYCVGCGICVDLCPAGAVCVIETTAVAYLDALDASGCLP